MLKFDELIQKAKDKLRGEDVEIFLVCLLAIWLIKNSMVMEEND